MTVASLILVLVTATAPGAATSEPVLLDFHSRWCAPCRQMRPVVELLARQGYPIKSIDVERAPGLAEKYEVQAVPTFIVTDAAGNELDRTSGSQPAAQLARFYLDARAKAKPPANSCLMQVETMIPAFRMATKTTAIMMPRKRSARAPPPSLYAGAMTTKSKATSPLSRIPNPGKRWSASGSCPRAPSALAPARSSTAHPRNR